MFFQLYLLLKGVKVVEVSLEKAVESDAKVILDIQTKAFMPLLKKYKDYETSPANESIDRVIARINNPNGALYKILSNDILVGAICIYRKEETQFWISPMFILPEYQGKGIAQKALSLVEEMFSEAITWELKTILEERRNCHLYEKMGYVLIEGKSHLNENTTLVHYKKFTNAHVTNGEL